MYRMLPATASTADNSSVCNPHTEAEQAAEHASVSKEHGLACIVPLR